MLLLKSMRRQSGERGLGGSSAGWDKTWPPSGRGTLPASANGACLNRWKATTLLWQFCIALSPINNFSVKGLRAALIDPVLLKLPVLPSKSLSPRLQTVKQDPPPPPSALLIWAVCYRYWFALDIPFSWPVCETLHCKSLLTHMSITVERGEHHSVLMKADGLRSCTVCLCCRYKGMCWGSEKLACCGNCTQLLYCGRPDCDATWSRRQQKARSSEINFKMLGLKAICRRKKYNI